MSTERQEYTPVAVSTSHWTKVWESQFTRIQWWGWVIRHLQSVPWELCGLASIVSIQNIQCVYYTGPKVASRRRRDNCTMVCWVWLLGQIQHSMAPKPQIHSHSNCAVWTLVSLLTIFCALLCVFCPDLVWILLFCQQVPVTLWRPQKVWRHWRDSRPPCSLSPPLFP